MLVFEEAVKVIDQSLIERTSQYDIDYKIQMGKRKVLLIL